MKTLCYIFLSTRITGSVCKASGRTGWGKDPEDGRSYRLTSASLLGISVPRENTPHASVYIRTFFLKGWWLYFFLRRQWHLGNSFHLGVSKRSQIFLTVTRKIREILLFIYKNVKGWCLKYNIDLRCHACRNKALKCLTTVLLWKNTTMYQSLKVNQLWCDRDDVDVPSVEVFKTRLGGALSSLV